MAISRVFANFRVNLLKFDQYRCISLSSVKNLKEIRETKEGNTITVEGIQIPEDNKNFLKPHKNGSCVLCSANLDIKYTDLLILRQFTTSKGQMLPRAITGLCTVWQKRIGLMVLMATRAGIFPKRTRNPHKRVEWKGLNTYYDENTIKQKYY